MRDVVQEQFQAWSYRGERRGEPTRTCASRLIYPLAGIWAIEPRLLPVYARGGALTLAARLGAGVQHTPDVVAGLALVAAGGALPAAWERPLGEKLTALAAATGPSRGRVQPTE